MITHTDAALFVRTALSLAVAFVLGSGVSAQPASGR